MIGKRSPISIVEEQAAALAGHLPLVRDGRDDATHDARVLTRRLRESLAIAHQDLERDQVENMSRMVKRTGRALGAARDHDVALELLQHLGAHVPAAAALVGRLQAGTLTARQRARRQLIKTLEEFDLSGAARSVKQFRPGTLFKNPAAWRRPLREHVGARAEEARASMRHASGVYFPNRSHSARLAIKKLRYALEVARATGVWHSPRAVRVLSKAQNALGSAHDRQVLIDRVRQVAESDPALTRLATDVVIPFLDAEIATQYARYLSLRDDLAAICDACGRFARHRSAVPALVAAGVGIPSLLLFTRTADRKASEKPEPEFVRVAVNVQ